MRFDAGPVRRPDPEPTRRQLLGVAGAATLLAACAPLQAAPDSPASAASPAATPLSCVDFDMLWRRYLAQCVQADGRVVDHDTPEQISTSEGQAYTLFLALVADDRACFDRVLAWTRHNLAGGDFAARLPAWLWGQRNGQWGVLDPNAASDADLWMAVALFEAARLWNQPAYAETARAIVQLIRRDEIADVPGLGRMLLPGPKGFALADRLIWRFNPSYSAVHPLRALATHDPGGPWAALVEQGLAMTRAVSPNGLAPDWVSWQAGRGAQPAQWLAQDLEKGDSGSYDAIRCYLWAGVLPAQDPARAPLLKSLGGLQPLLQGDGPVPEYLSTRGGTAPRGSGPPGFDAAVLPYLAALGDRAALGRRLERLRAAMGRPLRYYDLVLMLFGVGSLQGRWSCGTDGLLRRRAPARYQNTPQDSTCRNTPA
ncbi:cellulose synthase complex periplasmic endoglucanase BcsZ [Sphaerotilus uruguayifluvii]|uniref:cellulase n=1 Tax=Sphaerotilus uruguayifluvii TaxID=2735897 RepID=A0ABX2FZF4_9BURK|nr:cellulose synthase complex periplasmic endoglucanase BcsZ [Leptothrix sp. C29]NRT55367.1 endoglucanase [Leptothrix sp. C29]